MNKLKVVGALLGVSTFSNHIKAIQNKNFKSKAKNEQRRVFPQGNAHVAHVDAYH
jgi:hypothetical protein